MIDHENGFRTIPEKHKQGILMQMVYAETVGSEITANVLRE